jgi:hypothetical protein
MHVVDVNVDKITSSDMFYIGRVQDDDVNTNREKYVETSFEQLSRLSFNMINRCISSAHIIRRKKHESTRNSTTFSLIVHD